MGLPSNAIGTRRLFSQSAIDPGRKVEIWVRLSIHTTLARSNASALERMADLACLFALLFSDGV